MPKYMLENWFQQHNKDICFSNNAANTEGILRGVFQKFNPLSGTNPNVNGS